MRCLIKLVKIYIFKDYFILLKIVRGGGSEPRRTERKFKGGTQPPPLHHWLYQPAPGYTHRDSYVYKGEFTITTLKSRFSHCLDCLDSLMWEERIPKMADMGPKMADIG